MAREIGWGEGGLLYSVAMNGNRCLALVGLGLSLALAGCGTEETLDPPTVATQSDSPSPSPSASPTTTASEEPVPADAPACSDVWQDGAKLPRTYAGCVAEDVYVERDVLECSSGQRLVRFDEAFYAVLGGTIKVALTSPLKKDDDYRDIVIACRA